MNTIKCELWNANRNQWVPWFEKTTTKNWGEGITTPTDQIFKDMPKWMGEKGAAYFTKYRMFFNGSYVYQEAR